MSREITEQVPVVIVGGGLTGLSLAAELEMSGVPFRLLERAGRLGGQVRTLHEGGYTYEVGPNTGTISAPEVVELFEYAAPDAVLEEALPSANSRWIWKGGQFYPLPSGIWGGLTTPLFTWRDKLMLPLEPFRKRGANPNETVGELAERRLGRSMVQYAIDPFIGGIYAGDPYQLVTRLALPKLYHLEQKYGSFIGGAIKKAKEPKSKRERLATKKIFSARGGLEQLTRAVAKRIVRGGGEVLMNVHHINIAPTTNGQWLVTYQQEGGEPCTVQATKVITTVRADLLPTLLPPQWEAELAHIASMPYAPITEVSVGFDHLPHVPRAAFGGLVPSVEQRKVLGILFPSSCFEGRVPYPDGALFTIFMGGLRNPEVVALPLAEQQAIAIEELRAMMRIPEQVEPSMVHIEHYPRAIPQYDQGTHLRHTQIARLEEQHPGLHLAGGMIGGIGMPHRIAQGMQLGKQIIKQLKAL